MSTPSPPWLESPYLRSLLAGGLAGTSVDLSLYPLDTLKTRLQSSSGFLSAGGFNGIYRGVGSAVVGSAPGAALFFVTYDGVKRHFKTQNRGSGGRGDGKAGDSRVREAATHMLAASLGEVAACAVRVPTEVVKQRAQAVQYASSVEALSAILRLRRSHGFKSMWRELYRGWGITVMREVPFTVIQFPLWEALKDWGREGPAHTGSGEGGVRKKGEVSAVASALFGVISGAVAAAATTPLDVLKTRMMLAKEKVGAVEMTRKIWKMEGAGAFTKGIVPRTMWISIGGAVFLGSYQWAVNALGGEVE
ncbi:mitochondrial carrier [Aulographum hederae CBS 113979]|uniref:Mitochondrial carrier n=1 Tax=Aulographum hederae CBS 113979 TaxID=1176131 RepID=A0A6G1GVA8_9PEZI|nr:mitochondrial carrier [Aulographum hederae CBS 113979]